MYKNKKRGCLLFCLQKQTQNIVFCFFTFVTQVHTQLGVVGFGLSMKNGDAVKVEKRFRYLDDLHIFLWHIFLWHIFLWHIFYDKKHIHEQVKGMFSKNKVDKAIVVNCLLAMPT